MSTLAEQLDGYEARLAAKGRSAYPFVDLDASVLRSSTLAAIAADVARAKGKGSAELGLELATLLEERRRAAQQAGFLW